MTTLLEKAYTEAQKLPDKTQDIIAQSLLILLDLEELAEATQESDILALLQDELMWQVQFSQSQDALSQLANEALGDYRTGKTHLLNSDKP